MTRWVVESVGLLFASCALVALGAYPICKTLLGADATAAWQVVRLVLAAGAVASAIGTLVAHRRHTRGEVLVRIVDARESPWPLLAFWQVIGLALVVAGFWLIGRSLVWDGIVYIATGAVAIALMTGRIAARARARG